MITLSGVTKVYPTQPTPVLQGIDLSIASGEFVSIMGTSGSGKSTMLNLIGGLDSHFGGSIVIDDQELKRLKDRELSHFRNRKIGFVFQAFNLLNHLTVAENVRIPAYFSTNVTREALEQRTRHCLESVGLLHKVAQKPLTLSGGERQRVAVARALFNEPKILLADEPTGALDTRTGDRILDLFEDLNRSHAITLIIVTHDPKVSQRADRIVHLEDGRIVRDELTRPAAQPSHGEGI